MKAISVAQTGGPEVLTLVDLPVPVPAAGEALVKLADAGVNFIDVYYRNGHYKAPSLPFVPGQEGAGVVEALGPGVEGYEVGERVAYAGVLGAYAEYAAVPAQRLVRVPEGVALRDAAALMLQGMTAHYLANSTWPLRAGQTALVHAGAGGVGLLLTQLAKTKGASVITTVSTPQKAQLSKEAGADHVILYTKEDFAAQVREFTGGVGADVVYDSVGKTTFEKSLDSLRPRGLLALFGASSGAPPPFDPQILAAKGSLFLTRPTLGSYVATSEELNARAQDLFAALRSGALKLRLEHEYPLADAARAHRELESRTTTGKLLLHLPAGPA